MIETNDFASATSIGHYKARLTWEDAGSGASTAVALSGFPTGVVVLTGWLEIVTPFAGEADAAITVGDTADSDYLISSFNLNAVAATKMTGVAGSGVLPSPEADWATAALAATFSATELDDLTAGELVVHILYHKPE